MTSLEIASSSLTTKELFKAALLAREKAHSPYSGFKVGAAIRLSNGEVYSGCNIENSSYGATVCAERVAIQKAVSELGGPSVKILEVMVVTDATPPWPPCGICRQVICEFASNTLVYTANVYGAYSEIPLAQLFPNAFTPSHLDK